MAYLQRFAYWLDARPATRLLRVIEPYAVLFGVVGVIVAVVAFGIDLDNRTKERTVHAWQLVTTEAAGNRMLFQKRWLSR